MAFRLNQFPSDVPSCCEIGKTTRNKSVRRHALNVDQLHQSNHHAISHQLRLSVYVRDKRGTWESLSQDEISKVGSTFGFMCTSA